MNRNERAGKEKVNIGGFNEQKRTSGKGKSEYRKVQ